MEDKYRVLVDELSMLNQQQIPGSDAARITHDAMIAVSHLAEANQLLIRIEKLRAAESVC